MNTGGPLWDTGFRGAGEKDEERGEKDNEERKKRKTDTSEESKSSIVDDFMRDAGD